MKPLKKREDFASRDLYEAFVFKTVQKGSIVRMLEDLGCLKVGDLGKVVYAGQRLFVVLFSGKHNRVSFSYGPFHEIDDFEIGPLRRSFLVEVLTPEIMV